MSTLSTTNPDGMPELRSTNTQYIHYWEFSYSILSYSKLERDGHDQEVCVHVMYVHTYKSQRRRRHCIGFAERAVLGIRKQFISCSDPQVSDNLPTYTMVPKARESAPVLPACIFSSGQLQEYVEDI